MNIVAQKVEVVEDNNENGHKVGTEGLVLSRKRVGDVVWYLVLGIREHGNTAIPLWHLKESLKFGEVVKYPEDIRLAKG